MMLPKNRLFGDFLKLICSAWWAMLEPILQLSLFVEMRMLHDNRNVRFFVFISYRIGRFLFSPTAKRMPEQKKSTVNFDELTELSRKNWAIKFQRPTTEKKTKSLNETEIKLDKNGFPKRKRN